MKNAIDQHYEELKRRMESWGVFCGCPECRERFFERRRGDDPKQGEVKVRLVRNERGFALLLVLLFAALMMILVTTMLSVTSNEVIIAGLHRDSTIAFEYAESGVVEAIRRIQFGRINIGSEQAFTGSIAQTEEAKKEKVTSSVVVVPRVSTTSNTVLEIRSDATYRRGIRRISSIVQILQNVLPDIMFGQRVTEVGAKTRIFTGDVYSRTYIIFVDDDSPTRTDGLTYAGWTIQVGKNDPFLTRQAEAYPNLWPGHRRAEYEATIPAGHGKTIKDLLSFDCAAPGSLTIQPQSGDQMQDGSEAKNTTPLFGCDDLPYMYLREVFEDADGISHGVWFKTISFEAWLNKYWVFCLDAGVPEPVCDAEEKFTLQKNAVLIASPEYGAIPPAVAFETLAAGADAVYTNDSPPNNADFGCKSPEMKCAQSTPKVVLLRGDFIINAAAVDGTRCPTKFNSGCGHGVLLVDGNLKFNGDFGYWGTIIVNGTVDDDSWGLGNATVYGGIIANNLNKIQGSTEVYAGDSSGIMKRLTVTRRSWWER